MPVHDWTKVSQGIFHHFHNRWVAEIADVLNAGVLPAEYYALSEQVTGEVAPDVIALELVPAADQGEGPRQSGNRQKLGGATAVKPPPRTSITEKTKDVSYGSLRKTVTIRHVEGHEVVALLEILSLANKRSRTELEAFLKKAQSALKQRIHLLIVDVYPPGRLDPQGIHGELWAALGQVPKQMPVLKPLVASAYEAGEEVTAYVEPFAVGDRMPEMPLFLEGDLYVNVPLESSYQTAFEKMPGFWRERVAQ